MKFQFLFLILLGTSSCLPGGFFTAKESAETKMNKETTSLEVSTTESNGTITAEVRGDLDVTQVIKADENGALAGLSAEFPPGSLAVSTTISIEAGSNLSEIPLEDFGLDSSTTLKALASSVNIKSSAAIDTDIPFQLKVKLDDSASLFLVDGNPAALYQAYKRREGSSLYLGVLRDADVKLDSKYVTISTRWFGQYQPTSLKEAEADSVIPVQPGAPINIEYAEHSQSTTQTPLIYWDEASDGLADFYEIALGNTPGGQEILGWTRVNKGNSATLNGLSLIECSRYYVSIRAGTDEGGKSSAVSSNTFFTPDITAPSAPTMGGITGTPYPTESPTASWASSSDNCGLDYYEVVLGTVPGDDDVATVETSFSTSFQFIDSDLDLVIGTTYYISTRAVDESGNRSTWSNTVSWQIFEPNDIGGLVYWVDAKNNGNILDAEADDVDSGSFSGNVQTWSDSSGNALDFNITANPPAYSSIDQSIEFDGVDDHLGTGDHASINLATASSKSHAISFKTSSDITSPQVLYKQGGGTNGLAIYIASSQAHCAIWRSAGFNIFPGGPISADTNHTIAFSFDTSNFKCFIDGTEVGNAATGNTLPAHSADVFIGKADVAVKINGGTSGPGLYFQGKIHEMMHYSSTLSAADMADLHKHMVQHRN
jgi:hypothetical protein